MIVEIEGKEFPKLFTKNGNHYSDCTESRLDLFIEEEVKERLMTREEVAMWLTEKPHRQYKEYRNSLIRTNLSYYEEDKDDEADEIFIREDKGEWHSPIITE